MSELSYLTCVKLNWPISNLRSESERKHSNRTKTIAGSPQPRPQGLLLDDFQDGGSSVEDPGTQQKSRDQFVHGEWKFIQNGGKDKE